MASWSCIAARAEALGLPFVHVLAAIERHNGFPDDAVQVRGGWAMDRDALWHRAGLGPDAMDVVETYDDYPVIVMMQFEDLGLCAKGEAPDFVRRHDFTVHGDVPHNTGGGQLSGGQAGAAGGYLGLIEAMRQLTGAADRAAGGWRATCPRERVRDDQLRPRRLHRGRGVGRSRRMSRARVMQEMDRAAAAGLVAMQHCAACHAIQYPPRELCASCLDDSLEWKTAAHVGGEVLARTVLRHSFEPGFRDALPLHVGLVRIDGGPVALAFLDPRCRAGTMVRVTAALDAAGRAVLTAAPEDDAA